MHSCIGSQKKKKKRQFYSVSALLSYFPKSLCFKKKKREKDKGKDKLVLKGAGTSLCGGNFPIHSTYQTATGRPSPGGAWGTAASSKGLTFRAERHFWTLSPILPLLPFEGLGPSPSFQRLRCADRFSKLEEPVAEVQSRRRAEVRVSWTRLVTSRKRLSPPLPQCSV